MGFSYSRFLNRLLRTVDFSSVISGRTLSHVASLIAYTFKQEAVKKLQAASTQGLLRMLLSH